MSMEPYRKLGRASSGVPGIDRLLKGGKPTGEISLYCKPGRVSSGVPGLDELLNGGIPDGKVVLVTGPAGTGKTTFAAQFVSEGVRRGERGVFVTLEQDREKLKSDLCGVGIDMTGVTFLGGNAAELSHWRKKVKANWPDMIAEVEEVVRERRAKRVVIDSINGLLMLIDSGSERRSALLDLSNALSRLGCTVVMTSETQNTNNLSVWGFEEFVVDGVISIMELNFENYYRHALSVRKMRGTAHDRSIVACALTDSGLIVYPDERVIPA